MSLGAMRNKPCTCGSGIKYKKCHLPRIQGYLPTQSGNYISKDVIYETVGVDKVLTDLKQMVPDSWPLVLKATFPYLVMPFDFWLMEAQKYGVFKFTDEEIAEAMKYKSGFIGRKHGVECFISKQAVPGKLSQKEDGK